MLYLDYTMLLDAWVIVLSIYEYFVLLIFFISFEIFKKKKINFVFKIIYLSTHFSYVGLGVKLDYDNSNTKLLIFIKKIL